MEKPDITNYEEAVAYLYDMPRFTAKHTIEDTKRFLEKLGNPDRALRIIHVAGTNGKGSVCAYLRSILEAEQKSVCVFTSPHLVDIRERFVVRGQMISKSEFLQKFRMVLDLLDGDHPTFFEYLFFMAMLIFREAHTDYCILETGLGGRLDATNAVFKKELCVITRISLDHVEYLGDTVEKIAFEKAGIMKAGVPAVYLDSERESAKVFEKRVKDLGIKGYPVSKNDYEFLNFQHKTIDFLFHSLYYGDMRLELRTIARYQMENASLAVRAAEILLKGDEVSKNAICKGVSSCFWQGRMEEVRPQVYVDGAHNEDGIRAFLDTVRDDGVTDGRLLLFSTVADKDYERMILKIADSGLFEKIYIVHMKTHRAADTDRLKEVFRRCGFDNYRILEDSGQALLMLMREKGKQRVYVAGSLYLVGEIKEFLDDDQLRRGTEEVLSESGD